MIGPSTSPATVYGRLCPAHATFPGHGFTGYGGRTNLDIIPADHRQSPCSVSHREILKTWLRNNAKLALPYIERFTSLNLWMQPSTGPVLHFSGTPARVAESANRGVQAKISSIASTVWLPIPGMTWE